LIERTLPPGTAPARPLLPDRHQPPTLPRVPSVPVSPQQKAITPLQPQPSVELPSHPSSEKQQHEQQQQEEEQKEKEQQQQEEEEQKQQEQKQQEQQQQQQLPPIAETEKPKQKLGAQASLSVPVTQPKPPPPQHGLLQSSPPEIKSSSQLELHRKPCSEGSPVTSRDHSLAPTSVPTPQLKEPSTPARPPHLQSKARESVDQQRPRTAPEAVRTQLVAGSMGYSLVLTMGSGSRGAVPGKLYVDIKGHRCSTLSVLNLRVIAHILASCGTEACQDIM
jgi:hypothetical protein